MCTMHACMQLVHIYFAFYLYTNNDPKRKRKSKFNKFDRCLVKNVWIEMETAKWNEFILFVSDRISVGRRNTMGSRTYPMESFCICARLKAGSIFTSVVTVAGCIAGIVATLKLRQSYAYIVGEYIPLKLLSRLLHSPWFRLAPNCIVYNSYYKFLPVESVVGTLPSFLSTSSNLLTPHVFVGTLHQSHPEALRRRSQSIRSFQD